MPTTVTVLDCDQEPIHIPGGIQPHGCLLVCDANLSTVLRHSTNADAMLGLYGSVINGRTLDDLLGSVAAHRLRNALLTSEDATPTPVFGMRLGQQARTFDVAVHRFKGNALAEFEPAVEADTRSPLEIVRDIIPHLRQITTVEELMELTPRLVRGLLGYDRVMIYRFDTDGSGAVVGEARASGVDSFKGMRYPASDIPQQARALYLKNKFRVLSDSRGLRIPIEPELGADGSPIDLSFSHLRSVSPIHCEYLRNMGVAASMSISIIVRGKLWGLVACHHYEPRTISMSKRLAAELFGEFLSLQLEGLTYKDMLNTGREARNALNNLLRKVAQYDSVGAFMEKEVRAMAELLQCDGVGVWLDGNFHCHGSVPPLKNMPDLVSYVDSVAGGEVWATNALSEGLPSAAKYCAVVAGVLAVPLSESTSDYVFFFREEVIQKVEWAGNPEKPYERSPNGDRLTPRKSFELWKETVERKSLPWTGHDLEIGEAAATGFFEINVHHNEILANERTKTAVRHRMLNEELNHRVKNILALIKSLVSERKDQGKDIGEFVESLRGRINALAIAHDQVVRGDNGGSLKDLLTAELSPYRSNSSSIQLQGPPVGLDSRAFSVMALVFHEMATNAAKYGSLSSDTGQLSVSWQLQNQGDCLIEWKESGGPVVQPMGREGFGSVLTKRSVTYDLDGQSEVLYLPSGVEARFWIPSKRVTRLNPSSTVEREHSEMGRSEFSRLDSLKVLLVEDQLTIALGTETLLYSIGAAVVDLAPSNAEAMRLISRSPPDVVILDINLGEGTSLPLANYLSDQNIPFIFATGYGDTAIAVPDSMRTIPIVRKPYEGPPLAVAIAKAMGRETTKT